MLHFPWDGKKNLKKKKKKQMVLLLFFHSFTTLTRNEDLVGMFDKKNERSKESNTTNLLNIVVKMSEHLFVDCIFEN